MPWSYGGNRKSGGPPQQNDLEALLKRSQDKLKQVMPGGSGLPGTLSFLITSAIAAIIAFYALTFRVDPDELGVVMLFGKAVRTELPGLHFRYLLHGDIGLLDVEEIFLRVLDGPEDYKIDVDDVLVAGEHEAFLQHRSHGPFHLA